MLEKVFLLALAVIVVADTSTFKESLLKNVNRYKQNNFEWNIRNLNADNFVSLRKIENRKDREYKAYLQQLKSLNHGHALDTRNAMQYILEEHSPFKLKSSSLDIQNKRQQQKPQRSKLCNVRHSRDHHHAHDLHHQLEPHNMMYSDTDMMYQIPYSLQTMLYADKINPHASVHNIQRSRDSSERRFMYYDIEHIDPFEPPDIIFPPATRDPDVDKNNNNKRRSLQSMMYSDKITPYEMMYNKVEDSPQQMLYSNTRESNDNTPLSVHVMMYNKVEEDSPQQMLYSNTRESKISAPRAMQFVPDSELRQMSVMMYDGVDLPDPSGMMYNAVEENSPQQMLYSKSPESNDNAPRSMQVMFYDGPIYEQVPLQPMMYDGEPLPQDLKVDKTLDDSPQSMLYSNARDVKSKRGYKKTPPKDKSQENNRKNFMVAPNDRRAWYNRIVSLAKTVPMDEDSYFNKWTDTIALFGTNETARAEFKKHFPVLSLEEVLLEMASIKHLENLFWPFVFENGFMNQKLGLLGLSGVTTTRQDLKLAFYKALEHHQTIHIPATADKIVLSFNDESVVEGLNRSGLMETQKQYVDAGLHLFTPDEQEMISRKVNSALHLINSTMPQLYASISQVIGCIAYYKAQIPGFAGGSVSSSLGMIWQDPRAYREQSVAHYAEQIVHEFIHNSLFLADMVHGTFVDSQRVSQAKVYSPIRHELRDFDKTFHASYVSTGVALFHAKAGNLEKARKLLEPLEASVAGLVEINDQVGVLNESGNAMLQSMVDFLTVIRLV